jgi:hypothetical protein
MGAAAVKKIVSSKHYSALPSTDRDNPCQKTLKTFWMMQIPQCEIVGCSLAIALHCHQNLP